MVETTAKEVVDGAGAYMIRCVVNGRVYIGSSGKSVANRKLSHIYSLRSGTHHSKRLQSDYDEFGEDAFEFTVVRLVDDGSHRAVEQELIDSYQATDPLKGYNTNPKATDGGGRPAPLGRKRPVGVRLSPDVVAYCQEHPEGFVVLETVARESDEFKEWYARERASVDS